MNDIVSRSNILYLLFSFHVNKRIRQVKTISMNRRKDYNIKFIYHYKYLVNLQIAKKLYLDCVYLIDSSLELYDYMS